MYMVCGLGDRKWRWWVSRCMEHDVRYVFEWVLLVERWVFFWGGKVRWRWRCACLRWRLTGYLWTAMVEKEEAKRAFASTWIVKDIAGYNVPRGWKLHEEYKVAGSLLLQCILEWTSKHCSLLLVLRNHWISPCTCVIRTSWFYFSLSPSLSPFIHLSTSTETLTHSSFLFHYCCQRHTWSCIFCIPYRGYVATPTL